MLHTKENLHTITDVTLSKFKIWTIEGDRRGDVVNCMYGSLWITQEGDLKDYIVEAGKDFWVTRPGAVVIQALADAQFKYSLTELQSHVEINHQPFHRTPRIGLSRSLR